MAHLRLSAPVATVSALAVGLLGSGAMMLGASYSAFSATAVDGTNNWSVGTVAISDDDGGSAMFTTGVPGTGQVSAAGLKPGQAVVDCIKVTYSGSLASSVKIYATGVTDTNGVSTGMTAYVHVKIEEGTGSSFAASPACNGFSATSTLWDSSTHGGVASDLLNVFPTAYATGATSTGWTNGTAKVYRFTMTLDSTTPDTSQGASAAATFNWQAQNT